LLVVLLSPKAQGAPTSEASYEIHRLIILYAF